MNMLRTPVHTCYYSNCRLCSLWALGALSQRSVRCAPFSLCPPGFWVGDDVYRSPHNITAAHYSQAKCKLTLPPLRAAVILGDTRWHTLSRPWQYNTPPLSTASHTSTASMAPRLYSSSGGDRIVVSCNSTAVSTFPQRPSFLHIYSVTDSMWYLRLLVNPLGHTCSSSPWFRAGAVTWCHVIQWKTGMQAKF